MIFRNQSINIVNELSHPSEYNIHTESLVKKYELVQNSIDIGDNAAYTKQVVDAKRYDRFMQCIKSYDEHINTIYEKRHKVLNVLKDSKIGKKN